MSNFPPTLKQTIYLLSLLHQLSQVFWRQSWIVIVVVWGGADRAHPSIYPNHHHPCHSLICIVLLLGFNIRLLPSVFQSPEISLLSCFFGGQADLLSLWSCMLSSKIFVDLSANLWGHSQALQDQMCCLPASSANFSSSHSQVKLCTGLEEQSSVLSLVTSVFQHWWHQPPRSCLLLYCLISDISIALFQIVWNWKWECRITFSRILMLQKSNFLKQSVSRVVCVVELEPTWRLISAGLTCNQNTWQRFPQQNRNF